MPRGPIGERAMTAAERHRRRRERSGYVSAAARQRAEVEGLRETVARQADELLALRREVEVLQAEAEASRNGSSTREDRIAELESQLQAAQRANRELGAVSRLDPDRVMAALQPQLDELASEGRKNAATASRGAVGHCAHTIGERLDDWQSIAGGDDLARYCRTSLAALSKLSRARGVWADKEITQVARLTEALQRRIEQWLRNHGGEEAPARPAARARRTDDEIEALQPEVEELQAEALRYGEKVDASLAASKAAKKAPPRGRPKVKPGPAAKQDPLAKYLWPTTPRRS